MAKQSILITGGTGFLGSALTQVLLHKGYAVTVLSRSREKVARVFGSQVSAVTRIEDLPDAGHFKALINLAGAGIFDRRWSESRKQELRESRIKLTTQLVDWIGASAQAPDVFISGSAIGVYGDQGERILTEQSPPNADFAQQLCADWEAAALKAEVFGARVCLIRTGLVLGQGGGILQRMLLPFRFGLGGRMGDGRQWMSWIHLKDWLAIVQAMIDNVDMRGPYNATAPNPVTNRDFSVSLASVLRRPMLLPLPAAMLRALLGEMAALVLGSQRVVPERLQAQNFQFQFTDLGVALSDILNRNRP